MDTYYVGKNDVMRFPRLDKADLREQLERCAFELTSTRRDVRIKLGQTKRRGRQGSTRAGDVGHNWGR